MNQLGPEPPASSFLGSLTEEDRIALLDTGRRRTWAKGELLMRSGDPVDSSIVLLTGLVKVHTLSSQGAEAVLALAGPGDLLGEVAAIREGVRSASVTALEPIEGVVIGIPRLRAFLGEHQQATLGLLGLALARLHESNARRLEFAASDSLGRVASRLVELAERFGVPYEGGGHEIGLPITQEELASWSASSRESTARALRTLRDLGLIETYRLRLRVLDLDRLRRHAGGV